METRVVRGAEGDELSLVLSPAIPPGFRHGFTTRVGGVSAAPFDSLNLGGKWGDAALAVKENQRRLFAVAGAKAMYGVSQVHGARIVRVDESADLARVAREPADGLVSKVVGAGLFVRVADCTPILIACPTTGACAAVHAGWRGTVAGIAGKAVHALVEEFGCRASDLRVALGPCIAACCFEVGPEVSTAFVAAMPAAREKGAIFSSPGRRDHIDLRCFQRLDLEAAGVEPANIDASADCTMCDPAGRFFSYRRAGRATGQLVGFIVRAE